MARVVPEESAAITSPSGMLVNYMYDLNDMDRRAERYNHTLGKETHLGESVKKILRIQEKGNVNEKENDKEKEREREENSDLLLNEGT
jgi:hypothetical protein